MSAANKESHPTLSCMESVNRISKLPVVESTIQTATGIYEKVKDYNSVTNWTLQTVENTAHKAVDIAKPFATPVMKTLEGPIKKVDGVLCTGLDYVESKVPAVKLPTQELLLQIYNTGKGYVTPTVETAKSYVEPAVETAKSYVEPAVQSAKDVVTKTRSVVEPLVQPMVENVKHRVDEYLHRNQEKSEESENESTLKHNTEGDDINTSTESNEQSDTEEEENESMDTSTVEISH